MCTMVLVNSGARQPPAAIVRLVVHGTLAWLYFHVMWMAGSVDWDSIEFPTISEVGKFMSFMLTMWTLIMHLGFFMIATVLDFFELMPKSVIIGKLVNKIREMNDFFFMTVMLPISICVCSGFWSAWVLFNDIIYPSAVNNVVPVFINHVSHTTPIFVVFIELCLCYHASPRVKPAIASLVTVETIYLSTMIMLRIQHGRWVYLLIDIYVNTIPKFIFVFSFLSYIVPIIFLVSCLRLNNYIWGLKTSGRISKDVSFQRNKKIT
ncbi:androgen-dependent TFPI-regulating protein [Acyrthosiphon pisum]|uniref:Androgen-dependent TFPI-regulating protein n=1 Tax=Acyrthosiphon pisum TaxID=7029 RepID=A0A8R1W5T5_ACYPI|nr:androgen-dependent TFPI-regulating protein [Acyrthosiphon pisum]|eukprot:XP_003244959.1 PREDICTED: androgen-dependent TFPI-regulating protein-like [Acyrthosiphon pisum]